MNAVPANSMVLPMFSGELGVRPTIESGMLSSNGSVEAEGAICERD